MPPGTRDHDDGDNELYDWRPDWLSPAPRAVDPAAAPASSLQPTPSGTSGRTSRSPASSRDGASPGSQRPGNMSPLTFHSPSFRELGPDEVDSSARGSVEKNGAHHHVGNVRAARVQLPPRREVTVETYRDRAVNRRLRGIHLFMITISGVLGVGLYVRGGTILRLGGPLAVLLSFAAMGAIAWAVMQCIAEMLCIWPVSGALTVYVTEFVDVELGIAVGVAYWFTYAISFAALIAAAAAEAEFWDTPKGIQGGVLFFLVPVALLLLNAFGIEIYGFIEVIGGTIKLLFLLVAIVLMIVINQGGGGAESIGTSKYRNPIIVKDSAAADNWVTAFFMSLSIAAFAFVGVEIVAASALEARVPTEPYSRHSGSTSAGRERTGPNAIGRTVKFSAIYISFLATLAYVIAGLLVTLNIDWNHCDLPRMSWLARDNSTASECTGNTAIKHNYGSTSSAFILVAEQSGMKTLPSAMNVFLMFTALTCANTNLYVASRSLFSLTRRLDGGPKERWYIRFLAWLGKTNHRKVPMRAIVASCIFAWVPFLYLSSNNGPQTDIGTILDVLSEMGSVGVVIVWTCECWAFIRFYNCIQNNRQSLRQVSQVRRWHLGSRDLEDDYPYRSHGQPYLAYCALAACLFVLVVANGASLWKGFHVQPFLSAYLAPICFIALWVVLKIVRKADWKLVDLKNGEDVAAKMRKLHQIRFRSANNEDDGGGNGLWSFWGLV